MENREKLYRDNVHKDIKWDDFATAIINTAEFQRLDGIKQLGFAELVYRGAKHSRFDHSIGAYWLAKQIMQMIPPNHQRLGIPFPPLSLFNECLGQNAHFIDNISRLVSYASLLHDIAHIPFGHTLEDEFQGIFEHKHDDLESPRLPYLLFDSRSGISQILRRREPWIKGLSNDDLAHLLAIIISYRDEVGKPGREKEPERSFDRILSDIIAKQRQLLQHTSVLRYLEDLRSWHIDLREKRLYQPFMTDIVANTICSDILDYVKRDVFGTGLGMDFDYRILQYFVIGQEVTTVGPSWRLALCVRDPRKGIDKIDIASEVLNILNLRYSLAERVYYHKSKVSAGAMLAKALSLVEPTLTPLEPKLDYPPTTESEQGDFSSEREQEILDVNMTDDGFLCWLDAKATKDDDSVKPSPPIATSEELTKIKGPNSIQLAMTSEGGSAMVDTDINGRLLTRSRQSKALIRYLRQRKLYKPVVIITHEMATRERRLRYFTTRYAKRQDCLEIENHLTSILQLDPGSLVIYCPRPQPQVKQMETRVITKGAVVQPLWQDERFKAPSSNLARRYEHLWKLFIFLSPDFFCNPLIRQRVTEEFHRYEEFKKLETRELAPYPWLEKEQTEAWEQYASPSAVKDRQLWHPRLGEAIEDTRSWKILISLGNGKKTDTNLVEASAGLFLYDFEVKNRNRPSWLGLEAVLSGSRLKGRLFKNLKWKQDVEGHLSSLNRDIQDNSANALTREAYYTLFRQWYKESGE